MRQDGNDATGRNDTRMQISIRLQQPQDSVKPSERLSKQLGRNSPAWNAFERVGTRCTASRKICVQNLKLSLPKLGLFIDPSAINKIVRDVITYSPTRPDTTERPEGGLHRRRLLGRQLHAGAPSARRSDAPSYCPSLSRRVPQPPLLLFPPPSRALPSAWRFPPSAM